MKLSFLRRLGALAAALLLAAQLPALAQQKALLLDFETGLPIEGASFQYAGQSGFTAADGLLELRFEPEAELRLSHLNYGQWALSSAEVRQALDQGAVRRQGLVVQLYPVTVMAARPLAGPSQSLSLEQQDRLSHDGASLLMQDPAFAGVRKSAAYGLDPVFRGFKLEQLNVVLNGAQGALAACPNRMDPPTSQMAPNMLDRVEVLKGPHALRYGVGLGATLNYVPAAPRFSAQPRLYGRASTGFETNGGLARGEAQLGLSRQRLDASLFASWAQGDDYLDGQGQSVDAAFRRGSLGAQLAYRLGDRQVIKASAFRNFARDTEFAAAPMDLRSDDTWMLNLRHDASFEGRALSSWNTTVFASLVDHLMDNLLKPLSPRMMNASTQAYTQNYGARTEGVWRMGPASLYAGADFRLEAAQGDRLRSFLIGPMMGKTFEDKVWQDARVLKSGLFAEFHRDLGVAHLVASARGELNQASLGDPAALFVEANAETEVEQFNPSFSLGLSRQLAEHLKMGLWLGRAQRSASIPERYTNFLAIGLDPYEMLGDPGLRPEVNHQADLGLTWEDEATAFSLDLFAARATDLISSAIDPDLKPYQATSPGVRRFVNIESVFRAGAELNWTQRLGSRLSQRLGMAYTYAQDLELDEPLPEVAPFDFRYSLSGSFWSGKLAPELRFRQVATQRRVSAPFGETRTPGFSLLDLRLAYSPSPWLRLDLGASNLFDVHYYEHLSRPVAASQVPIYAPGRNFYASASLTF